MTMDPYLPPAGKLDGVSAPSTRPVKDHDISETELEAFAGGQRYPRLMIRMLDGQSRLAGFNPWAAIFAVQWFFFRKLYLFGLFSMALDISVPLVCTWTLRTAFALHSQDVVLVLYAALFIATRIATGYLANVALCLKAVSAIKEIDGLNKDNETHLRLIRAAGGVSVPSLLVIYVCLGIYRAMS